MRLSDHNLLRPIYEAQMAVQKRANSTPLSETIKNLVVTRASQINGCAWCLSMHFRDALKAGEKIDRLAVLDAWRDAPWFTDQERAALAWTEAVTHISPTSVSDELYDATREHFSEEELVQLTLSILAINGWNRMNIAFSNEPEHFSLEDIAQ